MKKVRLWLNTYDAAPFAWLKHYLLTMGAMISSTVFIRTSAVVSILFFILGILLGVKLLQTVVIGIKRSITGEARPKPLYILIDIAIIVLINLVLKSVG